MIFITGCIGLEAGVVERVGVDLGFWMKKRKTSLSSLLTKLLCWGKQPSVRDMCMRFFPAGDAFSRDLQPSPGTASAVRAGL